MFGAVLAVISSFLMFVYKEITYIPAVFSGDKIRKIKTARKNMKDMSCSLLKVLGTDVEVIFKDREAFEKLSADEGIIFVANHQSNFDIPVILTGVPMDLGFVAKQEMEKWPFFSRWMKRGNYIFLDRSNAREGMKSIKKAVEIVRQGYPTVIFPEGERTLTGEIGNFKKGSFKLALDTEGVIVPMTVCGTFNIQRRGELFVHRNKKVKLIIEKPVYVLQLSQEERKNLSSTVRNIVVKNYIIK